MKTPKVITVTKTLVGYAVEGDADVQLWGGGEGGIGMKKCFLPVEHFSKDNVLRCVNDNGFGVEAIVGAQVFVTELYDDGTNGKSLEFYTESPNSRSLFLGWKHLNTLKGVRC